LIINEITILVWIVCGIGAFLIAQNRGATNAPTWLLVGILFGPLGILLAAVGAKGPGVAKAPVVGAADELGKLAVLRDQGTITPDEFEQQKRALLGPSPGSVPAGSGPSGWENAPTSSSPSPALVIVIILVGVGVVWLAYVLLQQNVSDILSRVGQSI
jgi:hypothetical protein